MNFGKHRKIARLAAGRPVAEWSDEYKGLAMVALIGPRTSALAEYLRELVRARQTERIVDEEGEGTPFVGGKRRRHPGVCS